MSHYKPYPAYRDSGVEWIGEVPEEWGVEPFFSVTSEVSRKNIGMAETNILSLSFGRIIQKPKSENLGLVPESYETYQIIEPGEIVFRFTDLQNDKRSLRSALVCERGIITSAYIAVKPICINHEYFAWLMRSYDHCKVFYTMGGGLRQSLKYWDVKKLPVLFPPSNEQRQIINRINRETARIDCLIAKKTRFVELVTEKMLAMVSHLFEQTDIQWVRLQHVCDTISRPVFQQDGESYTRLGLYNRGRGVFKKEEADNEDMGDSSFFWISKGDMILSGQFAWEGAIALISKAHEGCVVSHRFPVLHGRKDVALTEYLFALLLTGYGDFILNDCSRGSAGRNRPLNIDLLLKWKIPLPSISYQKKVATIVDLRERIRERTQHSIDLLKERRSAFITAAVTGKIDLRESL